MPIRKYANASPAGRDKDMSDNKDMSLLTKSFSYLETLKIDKDRKTSQTKAADQIKKTLLRMSPAYKAGTKRRQEDPLAWRTEKILSKLRPVLSRDNFIEVAEALTLADPIERASIVQKLEQWWDATHGQRS